MKASTKDLRYRTKEIIAALDRGEEVLLTYRGEEKAKMIPITKKILKKDEGEDKSLFGVWSRYEMVENVDAYLDRLRGGVLVLVDTHVRGCSRTIM